MRAANPLSSRAVIFRLLGFVKPFSGPALLSILCGAAAVASGIGLIATAAYLVSAAALHPSIADLQVAIVGVRFFGLTRGASRYLERLLAHSANLSLLARLRVWLYEKIEPLVPARTQDLRSGDLLSRLVADVETLEDFYVRALAPVLIALLVCAGMVAFLASFHPILGLVLAAFLLAVGFGLPWIVRQISRTPSRRLVDQRAGLSAQVVDLVQGSADILAFGQEPVFLSRLDQLNRAFTRTQMNLAWIQGAHTGLASLAANLAVLSLLVLAVPLVQSNRVEGVVLAAVVLGSLASFEAVSPLPLAAQVLGSSLQAARRLFALADLPPAAADPASPADLPGSTALSIRGLTFHYPPDSHPIWITKVEDQRQSALTRFETLSRLAFHSTSPSANSGCPHETTSENPDLPPLAPTPGGIGPISLELPPGRRIAIVGPSGAGKTTLFHLLLRFWEPDAGQILFGGTDIRRLPAEPLRRRIAVIAQTTSLFNLTVRQNILLARPEASFDEVVRAAHQAQLHDFILSLPQGYDTWIGERGLRLSAGERQRLAVARALLKDAPLLLLDEPTANLDPLTGRDLLDTLFETVFPGRSVLWITHDLARLDHVDEILVLEKGRIVERGTHGALLAQAGRYRQMWQIGEMAA